MIHTREYILTKRDERSARQEKNSERRESMPSDAGKAAYDSFGYK